VDRTRGNDGPGEGGKYLLCRKTNESIFSVPSSGTDSSQTWRIDLKKVEEPATILVIPSVSRQSRHASNIPASSSYSNRCSCCGPREYNISSPPYLKALLLNIPAIYLVLEVVLLPLLPDDWVQRMVLNLRRSSGTARVLRQGGMC
jgi:hypothetical protein